MEDQKKRCNICGAVALFKILGADSYLCGAVTPEHELVVRTVPINDEGAELFSKRIWWHAFNTDVLGRTLNDYAAEVHAANQKWWHDINTGAKLERNFGELLALVHSELSEALEGHRKGLMDDKLPHRKMVEVELADAVIRILDMCGGYGLDLEGAYQEKMAYNASRVDHTREHRLAEGGKKY
jgi:NTP pyrophosphatase (non-canonical NTP hydrolase)